MSTYGLHRLFEPRGVAVIGASPREGSLGGVVLRGLRAGGFTGELFAVNPKYREIDGVICVPRLDALGTVPDLVVVATPAHAALGVVKNATACGVPAAIVLTAGLGHGPGSIAEDVSAAARAVGMRVIGPNCLGVLAPRAALNASFAARLPEPGPLALISQSGAIAAGVAEWAIGRGIGFSGIVSVGDMIDVDFGDCIDYFAEDPGTKAILLYVEGLREARKFMSAARKAVRLKPVIVVKSGRHDEGARAAATHTGAIAGADSVYAAALRRAGCVRVNSLEDLFDAAGTLAMIPDFSGERLAVLTNGGGLGVLAADELRDHAGRSATLSPETVARLDTLLPPTWSRANPVDIIGDAPAERYAAALAALLLDPDNDAILTMNCPTALTAPREAAAAVIRTVAERRREKGAGRPVFAVWLGAGAELRQDFAAAGIPAYETEAAALRGFSLLVEMRRRRAALMQSPEPLSRAIVPTHARAADALRAALADDRAWLTPLEAYDALDAYGIPVVPVRLARESGEAAAIGAEFLAGGESCVVKIHSRDIVHKSEVDGVRLGLASAEAVRDAAESILATARARRPEARIDGVTVQPMILKPHARELLVGMAVDPTFGPVIAFGHGGTAVEVIDDKALGLLPVDLGEARDLIGATRVARLLAGYRNVPAVDRDQLAMLLVRVSRLIEDHPEIVGLDLNPVLADATGCLAIDARIQVAAPDPRRAPGLRFAIRPYPRYLETALALPGGQRLALRPIRPTDDRAIEAMLAECSDEDIRNRFFALVRHPDRSLLSRLTQIDYAREMTFVALAPESEDIVGVVRLHGDADHHIGEFAILVRTDWQGRGLGKALMRAIIAHAVNEGFAVIFGAVIADNIRMIALCRTLGFALTQPEDEPDIVHVRLALPPSGRNGEHPR